MGKLLLLYFEELWIENKLMFSFIVASVDIFL